jgi:transcriptional regulator with XRE-family HTH domain
MITPVITCSRTSWSVACEMRPNHGSVLLGRVDEPQRLIAKRIGVSQAAISNWRSGDRKPQQQKHRDKFRKIYGIPNEAWDWPAQSLASYPLALYPLPVYPVVACAEPVPLTRCAA